MARIKLELPEKFYFSCELNVRVTDLNYGNHLGNDAVLSLMHEARVQWLKSIGASEMDFFGVSMIMADVAIVFRSEGFLGNQLRCEVQPAGFSRTGYDLFYRFTNLTTQKPMAEAKTGMVCFDYTERKVKPLPEKFAEMFRNA